MKLTKKIQLMAVGLIALASTSVIAAEANLLSLRLTMNQADLIGLLDVTLVCGSQTTDLLDFNSHDIPARFLLPSGSQSAACSMNVASLDAAVTITTAALSTFTLDSTGRITNFTPATAAKFADRDIGGAVIKELRITTTSAAHVQGGTKILNLTYDQEA